MKEQEKAEEIYQYAVVLHGTVKAKEESLKSAEFACMLAPQFEAKMKSKSYWEKVVEYLKKK
jgi:hypothetical protein